MIKGYKNYQFLSVKTKNDSVSGYNSHLKNYSVIFALLIYLALGFMLSGAGLLHYLN